MTEGYILSKEVIILNEQSLFHIGIDRSFEAEYAILPGDPGRVPKIAKYLDDPYALASNREFKSFAGYLCGKKVIVLSTGIGGPSAAIALEELSILGVKTVIRVGTCGGMQTCVIPGDLIIPTAAVRMEGTSKEYAPIEFPASADYRIVTAIVKAADDQKLRYHTGVIQSKDSFYGQHQPSSMPVSYELEQKWEAWKRLGVLASEMETAALFTVGAARKIQVGCVLHALWNQERKRSGIIDLEVFDTDAAVITAVLAMKNIINDRK